jgi:hypothetical protein
MTVYAKLQQARVELQKKNIKKTGKNEFAKFEYFELENFIPYVNTLFNELKLFSNFSMTDELATLTIIDFEDNSQVVFTSPLRELELKGCTAIQALGGVHTYLKRYLYLNALEIVEHDTLDAVSGAKEQHTVEKVFNGKSLSKETCASCGKEITESIAKFSKTKFGKPLCMSCQKGA